MYFSLMSESFSRKCEKITIRKCQFVATEGSNGFRFKFPRCALRLIRIILPVVVVLSQK